MSKEALLIFTKNPEAGKVKTRLAATVGVEKAFSVFQQLVEHTASITNYLPVEKIVFYSNQVVEEDGWNEQQYQKQMQHGIDLGERMNNAFETIFDQGYHKVVIIGTDCPELNAGIIMNAFAYLNNHDVVIGPAEDGGYYLLGMKRHLPKLFAGIELSTPSVYKQTLTVCETCNVRYALLPTLHDVDEEKDLVYLQSTGSISGRSDKQSEESIKHV